MHVHLSNQNTAPATPADRYRNLGDQTKNLMEETNQHPHLTENEEKSDNNASENTKDENINFINENSLKESEDAILPLPLLSTTMKDETRSSKYLSVYKIHKDLFLKPVFEKVVLNCEFAAVFDGEKQIQRPPGTTFRLGDEVVICSKARSNTKGRVWLFYYLVWERGDHRYFPCILHEPATKVTRTAPLLYVAHVPNGKVAGETLELVEEGDKIVLYWIREAVDLNHPLQFWDSGSKTSKRAPVTCSRYGDIEHQVIPILEKKGTDSNFPQTPPYAKRIEGQVKKLESSITKVSKGNVEGGSLKFEQENAKLKEENKATKKLLAIAEKQKTELQKQIHAAKDREDNVLCDVQQKLNLVLGSRLTAPPVSATNHCFLDSRKGIEPPTPYQFLGQNSDIAIRKKNYQAENTPSSSDSSSDSSSSTGAPSSSSSTGSEKEKTKSKRKKSKKSKKGKTGKDKKRKNKHTKRKKT